MATETDIFIEVDAIMRIAHKSTLISLGPLWSYSLLTGGLLGSGNVVTSSECHFFRARVLQTYDQIECHQILLAFFRDIFETCNCNEDNTREYEYCYFLKKSTR